jgi:hypothetical protein
MRVVPGTRIGYWKPNMGTWKQAFKPIGVFVGDDMGDIIAGTVMHQELMEGTLKFQVGVLFRPDRGKHQKLETVLIIIEMISEMFEYTDWEKIVEEEVQPSFI